MCVIAGGKKSNEQRREGIVSSEAFDVDKAAEIAERLAKLLRDKDGRGMYSWYVAVGNIWMELEAVMESVE
jgi:hypothetical protein